MCIARSYPMEATNGISPLDQEDHIVPYLDLWIVTITLILACSTMECLFRLYTRSMYFWNIFMKKICSSWKSGHTFVITEGSGSAMPCGVLHTTRCLAMILLEFFTKSYILLRLNHTATTFKVMADRRTLSLALMYLTVGHQVLH